MNNIRVGVTGCNGFIGYHLSVQIKYLNENLRFIPFRRSFFNIQKKLDKFVQDCDIIIHLAAMNRGDDNEIFETNINLVKKLIAALENDSTNKKHLIFASSTQRSLNNAYGKSKRESEKLLKAWQKKSSKNRNLTNLIIPNVFGPFCKPFFNSVIATFCHQINRNQKPKINIDATIGYIYVGNVVKIILDIVNSKYSKFHKVYIKPDKKIKVSDLLTRLQLFKESYISNNTIPKIKTKFDKNLFNTFRGYIDYDELLFKLDLKTDNRGSLFEIIKNMPGGQIFFSTTEPGIVRGNHFHTNKIERFCVLSGSAIIRLRKVGNKKVTEYKVSGDFPTVIDMPIFHTHNIENIGKSNLMTLFWSNEIYNENNPDTFFEKV